jgi:uncharacterized membrane protein YesL
MSHNKLLNFVTATNSVVSTGLPTLRCGSPLAKRYVYVYKEGFVKVNKIWTFLGLLLFVIGVIDIIYYWPVNGELWVFLIKKILYIVVGAFLIWDHLIKPIRSNTHSTN